MVNVNNALLVARNNNGQIRLGLKVTDQGGEVSWLNSSQGFDRGTARLTNSEIEATVTKSDNDSYDFEATIDGAEFVGWKQKNYPHCVGFVPKTQGPGDPVDIDDIASQPVSPVQPGAEPSF